MPSFDELKDMLAAAASAGVDEQTFGASGLVNHKAQKDLQDKYYKSAIAGRILSYIPTLLEGSGEARAGARLLEHVAPKGIGWLNAGQKAIGKGVEYGVNKIPGLAAKEGQSLIKGILRAAGRGAGNAAGVGTATNLVRKGIGEVGGTGDEQPKLSDMLGEARAQALWGLTGAAGEVGGRIAPKIYQHPALIKGYGKQKASMATANQMLKEGVMGGVNTFRDKATQMRSGIRNLMDELMPKLEKNEQEAIDTLINAHGDPSAPAHGLTPSHPDMKYFDELPMAKKIAKDRLDRVVNDPLGPLNERPRGLMSPNLGGYAEESTAKMSGATPEKRAQMVQSFADEENATRKGSYGESSIRDKEARAKSLNQQVAALSDRDKGKVFGELDGTVAAEKDRLFALQAAQNREIEKGVRRFGDLKDRVRYSKARKVYRQGADLEGALSNFENKEAGIAPDWGHAHTPERLTSKIANSTFMSLPVRTATGVALDRATPDFLGRLSGRTTAYRQRGRAAQGPEKSVEDYMSQYTLPGHAERTEKTAQPQGEENPYLNLPDEPDQEENPYLK